MIDLGISKLALIGAVALIVIGPEKLPRVARTVGTLLGKAQRYVNDVKAEVNRTMEMEELRRMKESVESAAREVEQGVHNTARDVQTRLEGDSTPHAHPSSAGSAMQISAEDGTTSWYTPDAPAYKPPRKNWRVKRSAMPQWYKARAGVRTRTLSGAARVARYRPRNTRT